MPEAPAEEPIPASVRVDRRRQAGRAVIGRTATALAAAALLLPDLAFAQERHASEYPLAYLWGHGPKADPVVIQVWSLIAVSMAVVVIVAALVLYGAFRRRVRPEDGRVGSVPLERSGHGLSLIYVGSGISFFVLLGSAIWGYVVLADITDPGGEAAVSMRVTAHQWWWEVEYLAPEPDRHFTTANEIHIPVGQPVRIELRSADVIHSFWVPALAGKMDLIPTQENQTWIQADQAGTYRGQCAEYCGKQHAHMAFTVTADPPERFQAWWKSQLQPAPAPPPAFMKNCAVCHAVRGTPAQGRVGPDLSHLMQRDTLAAGTLLNTKGNLAGWVSNPQHIKPGNRMPTLTLMTRDLHEIVDYLVTLR